MFSNQLGSNYNSYAQFSLTNNLQVEKVITEMTAARIKFEWEKWKLQEDLKTKVYEIQNEVYLEKAKTQDKIMNKWDSFIRD